MENQNKYVPIAIVIVGILIAAAIYFRPAAAPTNNSKVALDKMAPVSSSEHFKGPEKALVTVVEYSDLECPFCKAFQWTMNEMMATSTQVAWVYRQFPLNIHSKAPAEAAAAECAATLGGNDKFWQYIDKIYEITPSNNGLDSALLPKIATDLGLDKDKFNACINSAEAKAAVDKQFADGTKIGVDSTPFVIVINQKGEKFLPFFEPVPENWSGSEKQIVSDLLSAYQANIQKLRSQTQ